MIGILIMIIGLVLMGIYNPIMPLRRIRRDLLIIEQKHYWEEHIVGFWISVIIFCLGVVIKLMFI